MSILSCIARLHAQGKINDRQRREAEDIYNGLYERLYPTMPQASAEARAALETANILEESAKQRRYALARNAIANEENLNRMQQHPNGPRAGFVGLWEHDIHGAGGVNVTGLARAYETRAAGMLNQLLEKFGTRAAGLKGDLAGVKNVIRETFGVDTGSKEAKGVAKAIEGLFGPEGEFVKEAKALGKVFTAAEDWGRPQFWETYRARQFTTRVFKDDLRKEIETGGLKLHDPDTGLEASPLRREEILAGAADKIVNDLPWEGGVGGAAFTHDMRVFRFPMTKARWVVSFVP